VERVLFDGTTLMSATRLLRGDEAPSALNVFALSLMVEGLVLHDHIIALDTEPNDSRLTKAAQGYGGVITVERHDVSNIIIRYVEMEFPKLRRIGRRSGKSLRKSDSSLHDAIEQIEKLLELQKYDANDDTTMADYLTLLNQTHAKQAALAEVQPQAGWQRAGRPAHHRGNVEFDQLMRRPPSPQHDGTQLGLLTADSDIRDAGEDFFNRYSKMAQGLGSFWSADWRERATARSKFTPAMLIRTHFYLLASEVLHAPYRPDVLRAPICWKFFGDGALAEYTLEERFVDAAERLTRERVTSINDFLGRPVFAALPVFLASVLHAIKEPNEIIPVALQIRDSAPARRFREHMAQLNRAKADGDIEEIAHELSRYSELLRREFGGQDISSGVVWSLAASAAKTAAGPTPGAVVDLAANLGKGAITAVTVARRWWYRRKMSLIAKTLRQARSARSQQAELRRIFGAEMHADDVVFLDRLNSMGI
jgi:hypothetical protein